METSLGFIDFFEIAGDVGDLLLTQGDLIKVAGKTCNQRFFSHVDAFAVRVGGYIFNLINL